MLNPFKIPSKILDFGWDLLLRQAFGPDVTNEDLVGPPIPASAVEEARQYQAARAA